MERQPKVFMKKLVKEFREANSDEKKKEVIERWFDCYTPSNPYYSTTPAGSPTTKEEKQKNAALPSEEGVVIQKETRQQRKLRLSGLGLTYISLNVLTLPKVLPTEKEAKKEKSFLTPKEYRKKFGKKKKMSKKATALPTQGRGPKAPAPVMKKDKSELNQVQIIKAVKTDRTISEEELKQPTKAERKAERKKFLLLRQKQTKKTQARKAVVRAKRLKQMKERISQICGDWHSIATDWRSLQFIDSNLIQGDC